MISAASAEGEAVAGFCFFFDEPRVRVTFLLGAMSERLPEDVPSHLFFRVFRHLYCGVWHRQSPIHVQLSSGKHRNNKLCFSHAPVHRASFVRKRSRWGARELCQNEEIDSTVIQEDRGKRQRI